MDGLYWSILGKLDSYFNALVAEYGLADYFIAHRVCLLGEHGIIAVLTSTNIIISISYFVIAYNLSKLAFDLFEQAVSKIGLRCILTTLSLFFSCGFGYFLEAYNIYTGRYDLKAYLNIITAILSMLAAYDIIRLTSMLRYFLRVKE